ncbi:hypothetical protein [Chitinimonas taiwanensis]|uniref:hypothetical protein n=1 Tax=Chitinimonas taiwanensis TaxID=240412 RepID=UPI0035B0BC75
MISCLLSCWDVGRPTPPVTPPEAVSVFDCLLLAGHAPQQTPIAEGRDLLALADGANHLELALQLHCTF